MLKNSTTPAPSVNFHLWKACNMQCGFCYATFQDVQDTVLPKGHLNKMDALAVVRQLVDSGFEKITFAGGEPTLCPWLFELVEMAHAGGLTTMVVTNASRIDSNWVERFVPVLDWLIISADSAELSTNQKSGRSRKNGGPLSTEHIINISSLAREYGLRLKLNTVVNAYNKNEDMSSFVSAIEPERWKLFQVLPVEGQNDSQINKLLISDLEFDTYVKRHLHLNKTGITVIPENNSAMTGTYMMVDPAGRFFDNHRGSYSYSAPILEVGAVSAMRQVHFNREAFAARGGIYDWDRAPNKLTA